MAMNRRRCWPTLEGLETRLALSAMSPGGAMPTPAAVAKFPVIPGPPGPGTDQGTLAVLVAFSKAYLSHAGQPNYNPAFDFNHNGQIGQTDGKILLRTLPPVAPKIPLTLNVTLAPQDKARGHVPTNLGGVTHHKVPTILGHTSPGALVFTGAGTIDAKLTDPVLVADIHGNFSMKLDQSDGINQLDFRAVDAYGQQSQFRAFPILWLDFARYENAHPRKT
jgi:hypothetical protein